MAIVIDVPKCTGCRQCIWECPEGALLLVGGVAAIEHCFCTSCCDCVDVCPEAAISGSVRKAEKKKAARRPKIEDLIVEAEAGDAHAMYELGEKYQGGWDGPEDYEKAAEWYLRAAEAGETNAMTMLARLYAEGFGVTQDNEKAGEWYAKAAESDPEAMRQLGLNYAYGDDLNKDSKKAVEWYLINKTNAGKQ